MTPSHSTLRFELWRNFLQTASLGGNTFRTRTSERVREAFLANPIDRDSQEPLAFQADDALQQDGCVANLHCERLMKPDFTSFA
jgi:hypothetical protein